MGINMTDKKTVLLPEPIEEEALQLLRAKDIEVLRSKNASPENVAPLMGEADAIVLRTGIKIDAELLARAERLMTVSRTGAGYDNVDVPAATRKGIIVTSSVGANTTTVVEHTLALILALNKRLFDLDRGVRRNDFRIRYAYLPRDVRGQTLGVIGFGKIGAEVARAIHCAFGTDVLAYDDYLPERVKSELASWVTFTTLEDLCRRSDTITIHVPLGPTTRKLIGRQMLSVMKPHAVVVNTSRGGIIDEADLASALREKTIGGAALDVFEREPPPADSPLLELDNVILTPHAAALTKSCVLRMAELAAQRVIDVFDGFIPENVANPEVLTNQRWARLAGKRGSAS